MVSQADRVRHDTFLMVDDFDPFHSILDHEHLLFLFEHDFFQAHHVRPCGSFADLVTLSWILLIE